MRNEDHAVVRTCRLSLYELGGIGRRPRTEPSIMREEYLSRTMFHLKEGRRIVWVFDETMEKPKPGDMGRSRYDDEALVSYQYEYPP